MLTPKHVAEILSQHDLYWQDKREEMREYKRLYMTDFWENGEETVEGILRTEVPKAYAVVESYLGSLYAKNPAVFVQPDMRGRGNAEVAQAVANQYLLTVREQVEDATRLALIYTCSFLKLSPVESVDPLQRVASAALAPWEVIVDATASSWTQQRYVGHVYLLPLDEVAARFGRAESDFNSRVYTKWIDAVETYGSKTIVGITPNDLAVPSSEKWVRIVEIYDLISDKLLTWSEDYKNGETFVFEGVKVQVGALSAEVEADKENPDVETVHETSGIPFKSASGRPVVPIIPLYFSRDPDTPLRGYSLIGRSRDQFRELNLMRSYQAQGVRRMARQWIVRAGFLSEDAAAKITQGLDGEMIEVDVAPGTPLDGNITPVPQAPIPADIAAYANTVQLDISEAGLLAPFTRGEVTKSTATEQNLLAAYTSNEIGRMARIRDSVITSLAYTYNIILSVVLGDEAEPLTLPNPVGPTNLSADDLTGDFRYFAVDAGTTPMSDFAKQASLERLVPTLLSLGAPRETVLAELVRAYQLPEAFAKAVEEAQPAQTETPVGAEAPLPIVGA